MRFFQRKWIFRTAFIFFIGLVSAGCSLNSAKNHYILAEKLWNDGKYAAAVSEFEKVTTKDPRGKLGQQALYRAAMTQAYFLSQYSDAVRKFRAFVDLTGDAAASWESQKHVGEILFSKMEQYDQAVQHYKALIKQKPEAEEAPEFLFRIGKSQFFLYQFEEAVRTYHELIKTFPKTLFAEKSRYEIGVTLFTQGEQQPGGKGPGLEAYQEAIDAYELFLKKHPKSDLVPMAQFGIASCLEELDQLDAAYHAYEALQKTYPSPNVIEIKLTRIRERKAQRSR